MISIVIGCVNEMDILTSNYRECELSAERHKSSAQWQCNDLKSYTLAVENDWLGFFFPHEFPNFKPRYTYQESYQISCEYINRNEWFDNDRISFKFAEQYHWLDEFKPLQAQKLDYQSCFRIGRQFDSQNEWKRKHLGSYKQARKEKWLNLILPKSIHQFSFKECDQIAKKYSSRLHWEKRHPDSYFCANYHGWVDAIKPLGLPIDYNYAELARISKQFDSRPQWAKQDPLSYSLARDRKLLGELMPIYDERQVFSFTRCAHMVKRFKTKDVWQREHSESFQFAKDAGWIEELFLVPMDGKVVHKSKEQRSAKRIRKAASLQSLARPR